jgi:hypothetical protein
MKGEHDEILIKGLSIANNSIITEYYFRIPYEMIHNIRENITYINNNILVDDRHTSHSQLSTVIHKAQTGYLHLIADCLRHQQMLLPLPADTPTFPQIGRFKLPTITRTEIRIILWFLQTTFISAHWASCYAHSLYK